MKWIVKKETIFVQTVVFLSSLPQSRRVRRWNYEAGKKYHCIVATEKGLPPPSHHHPHPVCKGVEEKSAVLDDISISFKLSCFYFWHLHVNQLGGFFCFAFVIWFLWIFSGSLRDRKLRPPTLDPRYRVEHSKIKFVSTHGHVKYSIYT